MKVRGTCKGGAGRLGPDKHPCGSCRGYAEFDGNVDDSALKEAIEDAGYDLV